MEPAPAKADQSFLAGILRGVLVKPDELRLERSDDQRGTLFRLRVGRVDMPRIIGKQGQNIAALRLIMKLYARDGGNISLVVEEPTH